MVYTITFRDSPEAPNALVGGKGANLYRLASARFDVPAGFVVTTEAYHEFTRVNHLSERIAEICARIDYRSATDVEARADEIRGLILGATMPEQVMNDVLEAYRALGDVSYVAVRSSGTAEDLGEASFAGLHDTYLDVRGEQPLRDAIQACWASMWTARATSYRQQKGFDHAEAAIAVVVQTMVASEVSGVMFTANPLTAATDEIVINAAYGLGESIVQGLVTPDEFTVQVDALDVLEKTLGSKQTQLVRDPDAAHGTRTEEVSDQRQAAFCLTDEQAGQLAEVGRRIEKHYGGYPQDVEWALADGRFHVLQSRPVTGVEFSWDADVEDGNVNPEVEADWIWTREWADMLTTGGVTPLTYSVRYANTMSHCWNHMARCAGVERLVGMRLWKYHRGELYYNSLWEKIWMERTVWPSGRAGELLNLLPQQWHEDLAGAPFSLGDYLKGLVKTQLMDPRVFAFKKLLKRWRTVRDPESKGLSYEELARLSDRGLKQYIDRTVALEVEFGAPVVMALLMHMRDAMNLLALMLEKWYDGDDPLIYSRLVSGSLTRTGTQVENNALWQLAQKIKTSEALTGIFRTHEGRDFFTACEDSDEGRAFLAEYRAFATQWGHRGHSDRDMIYDRRCEDPGLDYTSFRALITADSSRSPDELEREVNQKRDAVLETVLAGIRRTPLGALKAEAFKATFAAVHAYIALRDDERQLPTDQTMMSYKRGFLEMGRRLAERGVLDEGADVHYLSWNEAYRLLDGDVHDLELMRTKVAARKRDVHRRINREVSMPKYLVRNRPVNLDAVAVHGEDGVFAGTSTSPGSVTGTARVVRRLADIGQVSDGEILVTNSTDPGWTPIFLIIRGIVVETGGILSHASCLAREYGFPAIQLADAMSLIPDGATISVDGDTGVIQVLEEPGAADETDEALAASAM